MYPMIFLVYLGGHSLKVEFELMARLLQLNLAKNCCRVACWRSVVDILKLRFKA